MDILRVAGLTDQGQLRNHNEDHWFADALQGVFVVSDGMGGRVAGELASKIVVEVFPAYVLEKMEDLSNLSTPMASDLMGTSLIELSDMIYRESSKRPDFIGMGATVVTALIRNAHALIAHVGDSRAYLWRDQHLECLTKDHSLVQVLIDLGQLAPEDAANHPARSQITQFIGMPERILPEVRGFDLRSGDRLLLCSDGLTGMVTDASIAAILQSHVEPEDACHVLISEANAAGGKDNITVVVIDWQGIA